VTVDPLDGARSRVNFELEFEGRAFGKLFVPHPQQAAKEVLGHAREAQPSAVATG